MVIQPISGAGPSLNDLLAMLKLAQLLLQLRQAPRLVVVTRGAQRPACRTLGAASAASLFAGGAWGLSRVLQLEAPNLTVTAADLPQAPAAASATSALLAGASGSAYDPYLAGCPVAIEGEHVSGVGETAADGSYALPQPEAWQRGGDAEVGL